MQPFVVQAKVTKLFFDRAEVQRKIGKARANALSRQGAFVRRRARTDVLRRRKGVSAVGRPPSVHSKRGLREIYFYYDARSQSVVVGPVKLNKATYTTRGRTTLPNLLEFGGSARIHEVQNRPGGPWFRRDLRRRRRPGKNYRTRTAKYKPRPFMSVALEREVEAGTIADSWRNVIKG